MFNDKLFITCLLAALLKHTHQVRKELYFILGFYPVYLHSLVAPGKTVQEHLKQIQVTSMYSSGYSKLLFSGWWYLLYINILSDSLKERPTPEIAYTWKALKKVLKICYLWLALINFPTPPLPIELRFLTLV